MSLFKIRPECGDVAFVQPELGNEKQIVYKCLNGHQFKKEDKTKNNRKKNVNRMESGLPEWARVLRNLV